MWVPDRTALSYIGLESTQGACTGRGSIGCALPKVVVNSDDQIVFTQISQILGVLLS